MILPRRLVPLLWLVAAGGLVAQTTLTPAPTPGTAVVFSDERTARLAERYKAMLAANPAEGLALDRLWKLYEDAGATGQLLDDYHHAADAPAHEAAQVILLGHFLKKAGRLEEAAAAYDRAAAVDPSSPLPTLGRAELASARSRPGEAAECFEKAVSQLPPNDNRRADLLLKTGDAWSRAGQPLKAAENWEKTIALAPSDLGMHRKLAENYEKNGLPERAVAHYEFIEAHADPAGRTAALRELGRLHELRGEFDAARDALERGLALTARDNWLYGDLQTRLIRLYGRAGRTPELAARWQKAVEQAPRDLGGLQRLELLAESEGDVAAERVWLEKITALSPRDRESSLKLARLLADNGEREAAAARYDALLQSTPGSLDMILARADLDVQMGRQDAAVARVESRLAANPADESVGSAALEFFLGHHLDAASEKCLRAQTARNPTATEPSLALAKFFFAARRPDDARRVLGDLCAQPGDPAVRAARWMAVADAYKEQSLGDDALRGWQQAVALQPGLAAPLYAAGDFLLAHGDAKGAAAQLEMALRLTPGGPEQVEAEHKLFQVLQSAGKRGGSVSSQRVEWRPMPAFPGAASGRGEMLLGKLLVPDAAPEAGHPDDALARYMDDLQKLAAQEPTPDHFLRLARWRFWAGDPFAATSAAEKAVELDPANVPARELLVALASDTHRHDLAERRLREIMALDPSRRAACLRQIAALKIDDNDPDAALEIYDGLQKAAPGSVAAMSDLASAQQRSERWYDALATWEHAYALPGLTPAQRSDVRRSLLAVYERLEQFPRAAEVLQATVDAQTDQTARDESFRELAAFCGKHDLGGWLEKEYRKRLAAQPNDFFLLTSLAALTRDTGREREGYGLLKRAYFSSPDPVGSLRALADAAQTLGESEEAIGFQRRLTAMPGETTAENLGRLAELQATNLDDAAAASTWEQIIARFPRDPNSLARGAEFFEGIGKTGRARELLQQIITLDANDPRRMFHLARLDVDAGDAPAARELLERLLSCTDPEKPGDPFSPPPELDLGSGPLPGLRSSIFRRRIYEPAAAAAPAPSPEPDDRHLRLDAIRELSRLLATRGSGDDRQKWLRRWMDAASAGLRNEPLAAFFFTGQNAMTMDLLARGMENRPDDEQTRNSFLAAGLRLGAYRELAQWAWQGKGLARRGERGPWLVAALQQFFNGGGKPEPGMVAELFPSEVKLRDVFWEAATDAFAAHFWYAQAAELGTRACLLAANNRAEYALKIAEWEVYGGHLDRAQALLRDAVDTDHGNSLEASGVAVFAALRAYYFLLPEGERATFAEEYLQRLRDKGAMAQATLAAALLHGLGGDTRAAGRDLDDLLSMRMLSTMISDGTPDARRWTYILNNGVQLQAWGLDPLAAGYWRHALKEIGNFDRRDAVALNSQVEIRGRLLVEEVAMAADPQQAQELVTEYLRGSPSPEAVAVTASQMLSDSRFAEAARLYEFVLRVHPGDAEAWRNLCLAYESGGDRAALERTLSARVYGAVPPAPGISPADTMVQLARVREAEGDGVGACRLLEHVPGVLAGAGPIALELAAMEQRNDRWESAAQIWERAAPQIPDGTARLSEGDAKEHLDQIDRAAACFAECMHGAREPLRVTAAFHLARMFINHKRMDDARALANNLLKEGPAAALPPVAMALARAGEPTVAIDLLSAAVRRTADPQGRYNAQHELAALYAAPGGDRATFVREMHRLGMFARADAGLRTRFESERYQLARSCHADDWLEGELHHDWEDSMGNPAAGEDLANLYFETGRYDRLGDMVRAIDEHPDLPEQLLHRLAARLVRERHGAMALPMLERLRRRFPQNEAYAADQARALWQAGRKDEARGVLEGLEAEAVFRDDLVGQASSVYLELGETESARPLLERAAQRDGPVVRYPRIELQLARLELETRHPAEAHRLLRAAYRNPTCTDFTPLVDYLSAVGQLGSGSEHRTPGGDIVLPFFRRANLLAFIYGRLTMAGQEDEARRRVEAHPELLAGAPRLVATVGEHLPPGDLPAFTAMVENAAGQLDPPSPQLERELAALHVKCAAQETNDASGALRDLTRAHELVPDDFDVARQLASACLGQRQNERAAEALASFLGADALPDEQVRARKILDGG